MLAAPTRARSVPHSLTLAYHRYTHHTPHCAQDSVFNPGKSMNIFYFSIFLVALIVFTIIFEQARRRKRERERERERETHMHAVGSVFVLYSKREY